MRHRRLIATFVLSVFSGLLLLIVAAPQAHADIKHPYIVDEKPQILFGDSSASSTYKGLENYTQDYVNGYAHITFTYTHHDCCFASYPPSIYVTSVDPRTTLDPGQKFLQSIYFIYMMMAPTDWYLYDVQFDATGYTFSVKQAGVTTIVNNREDIVGLSDTDWVALVNLYPIFDPMTPYSMSFTPVPVVSGPHTTGASNVLFLPGIEASRLYRPDYVGGTDRLWEPNIDQDVRDLYMNPDGSSTRLDIYAKEHDVIGELPDGENIYKSFITKMDELKTAGTINDWEPIAYDWRLSLDDILNYGHNIDGRIYYSGDLRATSTPYIIQELRKLAGSSKTGKVTLVAHSNGGLVAKRLTELLGGEAASLIDKMILVAVPQAGTPMAIPAGLHGFEQEHLGGLVTSKNTARTLAKNSPMEYHLLPSAQYFTYVDDPVVIFDPALTDWVSRYGATIHSQSILSTFLSDSYGRVDAQTGDIDQPIQFSSSLLAGADALHASLDNWTAPAGVELIQIAGWGVPKTVMGTTYKNKESGVRPEPNFTIDGDGTVVVPSALWTSTSMGAKNYWVDLALWNRRIENRFALGFLDTTHANVFEVPDLVEFVADQIANVAQNISTYPHLSITTPTSPTLRLRYALHSPLTLNLYDSLGRHTGISTTTGLVEEQIPGSYYAEFGETKYIFSDTFDSSQILMDGYATGTFTFNIDQYEGDIITESTTFQDIPTTANTTVAISVVTDISTLSPMQIDVNGDGTVDTMLAPKLGEIVTFDTTPPELRATYSTTTQSIIFSSVDDTSTTTLISTTALPVLKKGQKTGIATTTLTARDAAGNTTNLVYTKPYPPFSQRDSATLRTITYNGVSTALASTSLAYKWSINRSGQYQTFDTSLSTALGSFTSSYSLKKNRTTILPANITLAGMVVPYMVIKQGDTIIEY